MGDSVGRIDLDLNVNRRGFDNQMRGIMGIARKAGAVLAGAFAVKKLVDFSAQCIKLGSDLEEVQNVVDVTFPQMSAQVDKFAKDAASSFGLSETMAKRFTGTFGAMAKAFGFNERAAYEMSTALTGLAGDVASFYNISQDEAYTKLKSVFTGETETLKDLGIVMTQNALDAYAMANGYGKTTKAMSEAEKVALRYKFVQDQLSLASGDFIRTSDGWANQVRVLKLQFDSLKATIGQGLINVLTPVIKVINSIIGKLMSLANAFKSFTEMITGKKGSGGSAQVATGMEDMAAGADDAAGAVEGVGKAGKAAKQGLSGIDKLNVLTTSGGGSGGGGYAADEFDMGQLEDGGEQVGKAEPKFQGLINKAKELANLFQTGFKIGFGDLSVLDQIQRYTEQIKESLRDIFTDSSVQYAAQNFVNLFLYNVGKSLGAMASIGASIADNVLGGISRYLGQNKDRIKEWLISMFDIGSSISIILGNFSEAWATIMEAFRSGSAKQLTADIIGIFTNAFMGALELAGKFGRDVLDMITAPIIENKDKIKESLEETIKAVEPIFAELKSIVDEVFGKIGNTYDEHIKPMIDSFRHGLTEISAKFLELYDTHILPVIQNISDRFSEFREQTLSPLIDKFLEFGGKVSDCIKALWEEVLKPWVLWFLENAVPKLAQFYDFVSKMFFRFLSDVGEVVGHILDALGGLIDFLTGVFKGDWEQAWTGIKEFLSGIWEAIKSIITSSAEAARDSLSAIWDGIKSKVEDVFGGIRDFVKGIVNSVIDHIEGLANGIVEAVNTITGALNNLSIDLPDTPLGKGIKIGFDIPELPKVNIPRLAHGGFVRANTPQLAMIGDNRHQGEVIAPEGKLRELLDQALQSAGNTLNAAETLMLLRDIKGLLKMISQKDTGSRITSRELFRAVKYENEQYKNINGSSAFV